MMTRRINSNSRTGAAAVEFALTLPLLLLLLFGGYELSRANMMMHTAESAAYEGARLGIVPGASADTVRAETQRVLNTIGLENVTIDIEPANLNVESDQIAVTVEFSFADNTLFVPRFMGTQPFVRTCRLIRENAN